MNQVQTFVSRQMYSYAGAKVKFVQLFQAYLLWLPASERRWWTRGLVMKEVKKLATVGRGSDKCYWVLGLSFVPQPPPSTYRLDDHGRLVRTATDDAGSGI
jgi:hypothetical protein